MVAVFRSMARGLTISVSQDKIGKPTSPPEDITSTCSNNFRFKVSGALRAFVRISKIQTIAMDPNNIIIRYGI